MYGPLLPPPPPLCLLRLRPCLRSAPPGHELACLRRAGLCWPVSPRAWIGPRWAMYFAAYTACIWRYRRSAWQLAKPNARTRGVCSSRRCRNRGRRGCTPGDLCGPLRCLPWVPHSRCAPVCGRGGRGGDWPSPTISSAGRGPWRGIRARATCHGPSWVWTKRPWWA